MARFKTGKPVPKTRRNLGPLWFALAGAALLLVAAWAALSRGQAKTQTGASGPPRASVDNTLIDYGDVRLGTPIQTTVNITNTGGKPLVFTEKPYIEVQEGC
jgi:hypothetical protein